jgi:hypothetical protein
MGAARAPVRIPTTEVGGPVAPAEAEVVFEHLAHRSPAPGSERPVDRRGDSPIDRSGRSNRSNGRPRAATTTLRLDKWVRPQPHLSQGSLRRAGGEINGLVVPWSHMVAFLRVSATTSRRSTRPEFVIGLSGAILLVLSFVPWWGSVTTSSLRLGQSGRLPSATERFNAYFGYGWTLELAIALGVLAGALVLSRALSKVRFHRWLYFWIGLAMTVLVLASVVRGPVESGFDGVAGIEVSRGPLVVAAVVPSVLIALAGIGFARSQRKKRMRR